MEMLTVEKVYQRTSWKKSTRGMVEDIKIPIRSLVKKKYFICNEFLQLSETLAARETLLLNGVLNQKLLFKRLENVAVGPMSSEIYCVKISFKYPEN